MRQYLDAKISSIKLNELSDRLQQLFVEKMVKITFSGSSRQNHGWNGFKLNPKDSDPPIFVPEMDSKG